MSELVSRASEFASMAHFTQKRKYTGEPYFVHLAEVAKLLREQGLPDEVVAAGYLHDVVEDTAVTNERIREEFGDRVADLVAMVTDVSKPSDGNRAVRKRLDRNHLAKADADGQSIKLADIISNTPSIVKYDKAFAEVYLNEKTELILVLCQGNTNLYTKAIETLLSGMAKFIEEGDDEDGNSNENGPQHEEG